jgi:hypothetical protein
MERVLSPAMAGSAMAESEMMETDMARGARVKTLPGIKT